jgi:pyruvate dehydrogenase E2 component (dihydrolipoamide acetyltransferase)
MATAVKMPQLGMTMTEAKLVRWLKREGEEVARGEAVAEIETDKLNAEVESTTAGTIRRLVATEGDVIPVLGVLAVVGAPDEAEAAVDEAASGARPAAAARVGGAAPSQPLPLGEGIPATSDAGEVRASPIAKRLAAELGVNLASIEGSGPGGRIVEADVRAAAEAAQTAAETVPAPASSGAQPGTTAAGRNNGVVRASPLAKRLAREQGLDIGAIRGTGPDGRIVERDVLAAAEARRAAQTAAPAVAALVAYPAPAGLTARGRMPLEGIRRVIAERMHQSLAAMAQLTLTTEADATALVELRSHLVPAAKVYGHRPPSYTDLIIHLVARVLRRHPLLNSSLVAGENGQPEVVAWEEVNVGVAVSLDRGLIVPVIRGADQKPLQSVSQELGDLAERARAGRLTMDELQGGTFTITNLGLQEVDGFTPIINPPQCAILGIGRIVKKPAVYEDQLAIRQMVTLSLSFDHRVVDGVPAGAFLRDVKHAIEAATLES